MTIQNDKRSIVCFRLHQSENLLRRIHLLDEYSLRQNANTHAQGFITIGWSCL